MQFLILALIAYICAYIAREIKDLLNIESQITYLLLGIIVGLVLNYFNLAPIDSILPEIKMYTTTALLFMFFTTGFSINLNKLKKSGKVTAKLFSIPSYVETFLMSFFIYYGLKMFPSFEIQLTYIECLLVAAILSNPSPANTIPACIRLMKERYVDRNNIPATMIISSVIDSFITVPLVFTLVFIIAKTSMGAPVNFIDILQIILLIIIGIVLALIVGFLIGRVELFFMHTIFKHMSRVNQSKFTDYAVILLAFVVAIFFSYLLGSVHVLKRAMTLFSILIIMSIGVAINHYDISGVKKIIANDGNKLFATFGLPIIFMYVGSTINLRVLVDPSLIIFLITTTLVAFNIKGLVIKHILKDDKYSDGERKFAFYVNIPKGVSLVNYSLIFGMILSQDSDLITFMMSLAAVSIILTMSVAMATLNNAKENLLFKRVD